MIGRRGLAVLLLLAMLLCAGCWDRTELEQRGFVTGVAVDGGSDKMNDEQSNGMQKFKVTFHEAIPAGLKQADKTGSAEAGESYFVIAMEGKTMLSTIARLTTMTSRTPFFEHLKLIVISERVARTEYGFANVLDYFLRNNDARRNVLILIAEGEAKDVLETIPKGEKTAVDFVHSIAQNTNSLRMIRETRIGEVHEYLLKNESFVVQRVKADDNSVSMGGAAVLDGSKNDLVGFLNEAETQGLNFMTSGMHAGVVEVALGDSLVAFEVERIDRKIHVDVSEPRYPRFRIEVSVEGTMLEVFERLNYVDALIIEDIDQRIEDKIASLSRNTVNKLQRQFKSDVLGLGPYLKRKHPRAWKLIGSEWEQGAHYFSKSEIEVKVAVNIRRIGSVNNTEARSRR